VNKHYASASSNRKPEPTKLGESHVGLKQDINIQSAATDFSFETEEVTALYLTMKSGARCSKRISN
jgi:hypothetical protein